MIFPIYIYFFLHTQSRYFAFRYFAVNGLDDDRRSLMEAPVERYFVPFAIREILRHAVKFTYAKRFIVARV